MGHVKGKEGTPMEPFIGFIAAFGFNYAPRGWSICAGQIIAISDNTALFSLLGDTYGGDLRSVFGLPELRGRVPMGYGQSPGLPPFQIGQRAGSPIQMLSILELPSHTHTATVTESGGGTVSGALLASQANGEHEQPQQGDYLATSFKARGDLNKDYVSAANAGTTVQLSGLIVQGDPGGITVTNASTGNGNAFSIMQPYLTINFCIAQLGIYPPRN
jgi:microcystin-dependent protein